MSLGLVGIKRLSRDIVGSNLDVWWGGASG